MIRILRQKNRSKKNSGFTLIELLIAVAIVGILAAVAMPSYFSSVQNSRRTDATETLMRLAVLQEQHFTQYETYTSDVADDNTAGIPLLNGGSNKSSQGYYEISTKAGVVNGFVLIAKAINGQEKDTQCGFFTINNTNKRTSGTSDSDNSGNCW